MSTSKTEKPTPKKIQDAAKKGQIFRAKDLLTTCLLLVGIEFTIQTFSLTPLRDALSAIASQQYQLEYEGYIWVIVYSGFKIILPLMMLCLACSLITGLIQSGMKMATKALKVDFNAINPVKGFKKIFSMRSIKELIKSFLYLMTFIAAGKTFWDGNKILILSLSHATPINIIIVWGKLLHSFVMNMVVAIVIILILDAVCEFLLWIKELKMDKKEVERENRDIEGNPEIKGRRKELHREILSDETRQNIEKSKVVLVNPTHIAICLYVNKDITYIPFISEMEKNGKALAIKRYAQKHNVPIVEDVPLAREIFRTHKKHSFISAQQIEPVMDILLWLEGVDARWKEIMEGTYKDPAVPDRSDGSSNGSDTATP